MQLLIGGLVGGVTLLVGSMELTQAYVSYRLPKEVSSKVLAHNATMSNAVPLHAAYILETRRGSHTANRNDR